MQALQITARNALLRIEAARSLTGDSRGQFYSKIADGLLTKPVKIGPRAVALPVREIEAVNAARIRGASEAEIRALVTRLHTERATQA